MRTRIAGHPLSCAPIDVMLAPSAFLIASMDPDLVRQYPQVFEYGMSEYAFHVDSFIRHVELGDGEGAAVGVDRDWLIPFQNCVSAQIYQDQHDPSRRSQLRPDYTVVCKGAIVLKVESKGTECEMPRALVELTEGFHSTASGQFPTQH